jgi:hypothetical protein
MIVEMPVYDIYSKRKRQQEKAGRPDIYKYDEIPEGLRNQVICIWRDAIGTKRADSYDHSNEPPDSIWIAIHDILCRELGLSSLGRKEDSPFTKCCTFLLEESDIDKILSLIEISFRMIERICSKLDSYAKHRAEITQEPDDAIDELNTRFKEHGLGYQYAGGRIVRMDSQYMHTEAVLPAISLLQQPGFEGASDEFLDAHKHYREGNNKDAISAALRAFESTMKSICSLMGWEFPENATARPLIDICIENGLIPQPLQGHFGSLRATLENGLPTISNRLARHGQGKKRIIVPDHYTAYALHLAATNIVFLVEAYTAIKKQ